MDVGASSTDNSSSELNVNVAKYSGINTFDYASNQLDRSNALHTRLLRYATYFSWSTVFFKVPIMIRKYRVEKIFFLEAFELQLNRGNKICDTKAFSSISNHT